MSLPRRRVWRIAPTTFVVVALFAVVAGVCVPILSYLLYRREESPYIPAFLVALTVLALLYAWRFGLHPRLRTTEDGVIVINPFRRHRFAWEDIRVVAPSENGLVIASLTHRADAWCVQKSNFSARRGRITRCDRIAGELLDVLDDFDRPLADTDTSLHLRRARPDESRRLMRIERAASEAEFSHIFPPDEYPYPSAEVTKRWRRLLREPKVRIFVLELLDAPVGLVAFTADTVLHLAVVPHQMRRGYGSALMGYATNEIFASGAREAHLWVLVENHGGRAFYRSHRWMETDRRRDCDYPPSPAEMKMTRKNPAAPRRSR